MRVWLIEIGEPLPIDPGPPRLMRIGMLAAAFGNEGHHVEWWASRFDHRSRRQRATEDSRVAVHPRLHIRLLDGPGYKASVGLARIRHHRVVAAQFVRQSESAPTPDVIVCCVPTLELASAAVDYGIAHGCPVFLDLRDLWPDILFDLVPSPLRPIARRMGRPIMQEFSRACAGATGLIAITEEFLDWGLAYAGRSRRATDRVVPHAYSADMPPQDALDAAGAFWAARGITGAPESFVVVAIGSLSRRLAKGGHLDDAFAAAAALRDACPTLKLVICGSGDALPHWQRVAAARSNVVVAGHVGHAEIVSVLEKARIGMVPYPNDPDFIRSLPNKVGEYLSRGVPVVSSLGGALGRFLADHGCGTTYPPGDVEALAGHWLALYTDEPRRAKLAARARDAWARHLSADVVYSSLVHQLEQVAARVGGSPRGSEPKATIA